jgi:hypothetical protein
MDINSSAAFPPKDLIPRISREIIERDLSFIRRGRKTSQFNHFVLNDRKIGIHDYDQMFQEIKAFNKRDNGKTLKTNELQKAIQNLSQ